MAAQKWKCGKPLLNRELDKLENGSIVWVIYWRDGEKYWDEPFPIFRKDDGSYDLWNMEYPYEGYGEYFISDMSDDPNEQAARDTRGGIFLFHAEQVEAG